MRKVIKCATLALVITTVCFALFSCDTGTGDGGEACAHSWGEWISVKDAGCETVGSEQRECGTCHETETRKIAALGHDLLPDNGDFDWTNGYTEATYTYPCSRCGIKETVIAEVTVNSTPADCESESSDIHTATVTVNGREYSENITGDGPALGHDYDLENGEWTWYEKDKAKVELTCKRDSTHKHTIEASITSETVNSTCSEDEYVIYTAEATYDGTLLTDTFTEENPDTAAHDYDLENIVWEWNEELSAVTFTVKCKRDATHVHSETHQSTFVTVPAGCTENGETVYTVTVSFGGVTYTDTKTVVHTATDHRYDAENGVWKWNEDYSAAEYTVTCLIDGTHTETLTANVEVAKAIPSCLDYTEDVYTATVEYNGVTYTIEVRLPVDVIPHDYDFDSAVWCWSEDHSIALLTVTCKNGGQHSDDLKATVESEDHPVTCTSDGCLTYTATVVYGGVTYKDVKKIETPRLGHKYEIKELEWGETQSTAVIVCGNDAAHVHTVTSPVTATAIPEGCETDGSWNYTVTFEVDETTLTAEMSRPIPAHGHDYKDRLCTICKKYRPSVGLEFVLMDDGAGYKVMGRGECTDSLLVIPAKHNGLPVVEVGYSAFYGDTAIEELHIPGSVKVIQVDAFRGCSGIKKLVLEEGVEIVGIDAFTSMNLLRELILPESLTAIGTGAFAYCSSLTRITLPKNLNFLGENAFLGCDKLMEVENLSDKISLTLDIESNIFLERGPKHIYTAASGSSRVFKDENGFVFFEGDGYCYLLAYYGDGSNFELPESCNGRSYYIYHQALAGYYCYDFTAVNVVVTIPDAVLQIGNNAFAFCDWIVMVNGGRNVNYIGECAFAGCNELLSVTVGANVKSLGAGVFNQCKRLVELFNFSSITPNGLWIKNERLATHTSPDAVTCIYKEGDYFFFYDGTDRYLLRYLGNSTAVTLPEQFKGGRYSIAGYAFDESDGVTEVVISRGVDKICESAFVNCASLVTVTMASDAAPTRIEKWAFDGTGITSIRIPSSVTFIAGRAFSETLVNAYFESTSNWRSSRWDAKISESTLSNSASAAEYMHEKADYDMYVEE